MTHTNYPKDKCIHEFFEAQVERTPDAVAVEFENQRLTYHDLNCRANQLARHLQKRGVVPGALVGICVERSLEIVIGLLGILKAGGAYVPLDPAYPRERLAFMLEDIKAPVFLTQQKLKSKAVGWKLDKCHTMCFDSEWEAISQESKENLVSDVTAKNLAYVIYTSGSTGKPKGVLIGHDSIVSHCQLIQKYYELNLTDRVLQFASFNFDASLEQILPTLIAGATLIIRGKNEWAPKDIHKQIIEYGITVMNIPPAYWHQLTQEWLKTPELLCDQLRLVIVGGDVMLPETLNLWQQLPTGSVRLFNAYGPTESTITAALFEVNCRFSECSPHKKIPIGFPLSNKTFYLLDVHGNPVPVGIPGELHIGGEGLAWGYLNRPELTAERFIPNLFSKHSGDRLYKTGDLARYLTDGSLEFLGRLDHQVKIRGFRIELGEIESVLRQYPSVQEAIVVAQEEQSGKKRLVAYVVPDEGQTCNINALHQFLEETIPDYMIPSAFVTLEALPLTPSGKIDRRALPVPTRSGLEESYVAPRTPTEEILAKIWADILGLERIGIHDNFFLLGGHSLLSVKLISQVTKTFQIELPAYCLFELPSIEKLAQAIDKFRRELSETEVYQAPIKSESPMSTARSPQKECESYALPIHAISRDRKFPLSFPQQLLWFFSRLYPEQPIYNETCTIRLIGEIDVAALEQSFTELIRRHEILRTTFAIMDEHPMQVIHAPAPFHLKTVDLRDLPESDREAEALRLATEDLKQPFDLSLGPLWRVLLIQLETEDYRLFLADHHLITDGISLYDIFHPELETLYTAFSNGAPSPLPELTIQYADFAVWQRQRLQENVLAPHLDYWKKKLANLPILQLPTDRPRSDKTTFQGTRQCLSISGILTEKLTRLSHQEGTTLFMTLVAAVKILLFRYSAQEDIAIGTVTAGRDRPEIEKVMGNFLNTLVLRTDLSGDPTFKDFLQRVRTVAMEAYAHQELPFDTLVSELQPERNISQNPLFQVAFVLEPPLSEHHLEWSLSQLDIHPGTAKFDLTFELDERPEGLIGRIEYSTELFDDTTISRMIGHFRILLEGIADNPEQRISELPLLTETDQHQILVERNETKTEYPKDVCIHRLFEIQAEQTPDAIAVVSPSDDLKQREDQKLSYQELNNRANQLAHYLQKLGVGSETLVGICMERSLEMIVGVLGILKAGGTYVPLDPAYPKERLAFMLEDTQAQVVVTQQSLREHLSELEVNIVCLGSDWETISLESIEHIRQKVLAEHLAYVIYTSGSTGQPKGVAVSHQAVTRLLFNTNYIDLKSSDKIAHVSNVSFDAATFEIWGALLHGGQIIVVPKGIALSLQDFATYIREQEITTLFLTTALFNQLAGEVPQAFSSLRHLLFGGEAVVPKWVRAVLHNGPPKRLLHVYGPTESTTFASWYLVRDVPDEAVTIPIGHAISNTQTYVLDFNLQPVPTGIPGELYIGGDGLARGYLNRPDLTAETFVPHPFSDEPGARLYKTGDLARYLPNGSLEFLGRTDHQIKLRGFRIELGEVEAILRQHPTVQETVAMIREDLSGDKRLVAYVIASQQLPPTINELRRFLQQKLPDYMIPSTFVVLDAFPLTPNGKVDRRALPMPGQSRPELEEIFRAPRTPTEEMLADIWSQLLGFERVGIHDNFFQLGGHSLLATQLISRIRRTFAVELPLRILFEAPTVVQLAERIQMSHWAAQNLEDSPDISGNKREEGKI